MLAWMIAAVALAMSAICLFVAYKEARSHFTSEVKIVTNRPGRGLSVLPPHKVASDIDNLADRLIENWKRLPPRSRKICVDHLRDTILKYPDGEELLDKWALQKRSGLRVGCDEVGFHFGTGMFVRNVLREIIRDHHLPSAGKEVGNWDDFYYGAIDQLAGSK